MEQQELINALKAWRGKDKENRAYVLVIAERISEDTQSSDIIINGNRGGIIVSLSEFIKQEPNLFQEAALYGAMTVMKEREKTDKDATQTKTKTKTKTKTS